MNNLNYICENYKTCWDKEMALPEDERCPHVLPHDYYPMCDVSCESFIEGEIHYPHCRKITLKKEE